MEGERKRPRDDGNGHEHIELPKAKRPRVEPIPGDTGVAASSEEASTFKSVSGNQNDTTIVQESEGASTSDYQEDVLAQDTASAGVAQGVDADVVLASIDSETVNNHQPPSDEAFITQSEAQNQKEAAPTFEAPHIGESSSAEGISLVEDIEPQNERPINGEEPPVPSESLQDQSNAQQSGPAKPLPSQSLSEEDTLMSDRDNLPNVAEELANSPEYLPAHPPLSQLQGFAATSIPSIANSQDIHMTNNEDTATPGNEIPRIGTPDITDSKSANISMDDTKQLDQGNSKAEDSNLSEPNKFHTTSETSLMREVESETTSPTSHPIEPCDTEMIIEAVESPAQNKEQFASSGDVRPSFCGSTTGETKIANPSYGNHGQRASTPPTRPQAGIGAGCLQTPVSNSRNAGTRAQSPGFNANTAKDQSFDPFPNQSRENDTKNNDRSESSLKDTKSKLSINPRPTQPSPSKPEMTLFTPGPDSTFQKVGKDSETGSDLGSNTTTKKSQGKIPDHKFEAATKDNLNSKVDHPAENEPKKQKSEKGKPKPVTVHKSSGTGEAAPKVTPVEPVITSRSDHPSVKNPRDGIDKPDVADLKSNSDINSCSNPIDLDSKEPVEPMEIKVRPLPEAVGRVKFPVSRSKEAGVYIILSDVKKEYRYKLSLSTLKTHSSLFSESHQDPVDEADEGLLEKLLDLVKTPILYELTKVDSEWKLMRQPFTSKVPCSKNRKIPSAPDHILKLHHNLLSAIFQLPLSFMTPSDDANFSISCRLLRLARTVHGPECWEALIPLLRTAWKGRELPHHLFQKAASDPTYALKFAEMIQNGELFREATIHLVGCLPKEGWNDPDNDFSDRTLNLIKSKHAELQEAIIDFKDSLTDNAIVEDDRYVGFRSDGNSPLCSWVVMNMWREEFRKRMRLTPIKERGLFFEELREGGDAYMRANSVESLVRKNLPHEAWDTVEEDLALMKDWAAYKVRPFLVDNSSLNLAEEGVTWLTCTELSDEELPWN